ncbi:MAG: hypothetical protein ACI4SG_05925, partial [Oligosphaeraceae bacterium]
HIFTGTACFYEFDKFDDPKNETNGDGKTNGNLAQCKEEFYGPIEEIETEYDQEENESPESGPFGVSQTIIQNFQEKNKTTNRQDKKEEDELGHRNSPLWGGNKRMKVPPKDPYQDSGDFTMCIPPRIGYPGFGDRIRGPRGDLPSGP